MTVDVRQICTSRCAARQRRAPHLQSAREAACLHLDREGAANVAFGYAENANLVYLSSGKSPYTIRLA